MAYLTEPEPPRNLAQDVIAGVRRVVADNPGPMTYHGTNTFMIETPEGLLILDPGPDHPAHIAAVSAAAGGQAFAIVLSHGHYDHCAGARSLAAALNVPVYGFSPFESSRVTIDQPLADGDVIGGLAVLHTPGHASDHLCFARADGVVFTGDHIMGWSSSVVPYPSGSMANYIRNLERLRDRRDRLHLPGHGPVLPDPYEFINDLIQYRLRREQAILTAIDLGFGDVDALTAHLYAKRGAHLRVAAEHNVRAHLVKLHEEGRVEDRDGVWSTRT